MFYIRMLPITIIGSMFWITWASVHAESETQVDLAPSGIERNEIFVDHETGVVLGMPGKDAGEIRGNHIDFEAHTDAATENRPENFDPDTSTVIHENE